MNSDDTSLWKILIIALFMSQCSYLALTDINNLKSPLPHRLLSPRSSQQFNQTNVRPNVVEENPSLDIGPLSDVTVERGDTARLPCGLQRLQMENSSKLVLWYRNDTSRPFMSYDSRDKGDHDSWSDNKEIQSREPNRISLRRGGLILILRKVTDIDQAEYRCKVHYSHFPSIYHRLKLVVQDISDRMQLTDAEDRSVGNHFGPLSEGGYLSIFCRANFDLNLVSLGWMIDGKIVASSWSRTQKGKGSSNLQLVLDRTHANSMLTCRATVEQNSTLGIKKSIFDVSTSILMYYVPQATLLVDSAGAKLIQTSKETQGGTYEVTEGITINFICAVKARPSPYNIAWLHNGRIIGSGGRRWTSHNSSLVVSPVTKEDTGLYTCLASNSEGDGQSNAVSLRVHHAPFCVSSDNNKVVVGKNVSATVVCEVEAEPPIVNFTWSYESSSGLQRSFGSSGGMQIYTPNSPSNQHFNHNERTPPISKVDPENPKKAILTVPYGSDITEVQCYARNKVGRMRVPCSFTLSFIEPPAPLQGCNVTHRAPTILKISCVPGYAIYNERDGSPDLSYVLSPHAKTTSQLEVWIENRLMTNLAHSSPTWTVHKLPPDTEITLKAYSVAKHTHSEPVILYAKTKPLFNTALQDSHDITPDTQSESPEESELAVYPGSSSRGLNIVTLIGGLVATLAAMIGILSMSVILIRRKGRRRDALVEKIRENQEAVEPVPLDDTEPDNLPCSIEIHIETTA